MSDYAQLQEQLAIALSTPEAMSRRQPGQEQAYWLDMEKRNPPPPPEPALQMARTQAEWHQVQQALVLEQTPPAALAMAQAVSEGVEPGNSEEMQKQRQQDAQKRVEIAKKDLQDWRSGKAPDLRGPRSANSPASTPGYVPAPVQGQVPPVPGEVEVAPDHERAHQRIAAAHRQAAEIHGQEGQAQPANQPQHAQAAAAHQQQAQIHDMESRGTPNAPSAPETAEEVAKQEEEKKRLEGQTQVTHPPTEEEKKAQSVGKDPQDPAALAQAQAQQPKNGNKPS